MCIWRNIKSEGAFFFIFLFVPSHLNLESHHISLQPVFWRVLKEIAKIACCFHRVWPSARNNWIPPDGFARKLILPTFIRKFMARFSYWFKNLCHFTRRPTQICDSFGYRVFRITSLLWLTGTHRNGFTPKLCAYFSVCGACYMSPPLSSCLTLLL